MTQTSKRALDIFERRVLWPIKERSNWRTGLTAMSSVLYAQAVTLILTKSPKLLIAWIDDGRTINWRKSLNKVDRRGKPKKLAFGGSSSWIAKFLLVRRANDKELKLETISFWHGNFIQGRKYCITKMINYFNLAKILYKECKTIHVFKLRVKNYLTGQSRIIINISWNFRFQLEK